LANAAWVFTPSTAITTDALAGANTNLTTANLVKSPGSTVLGAAVGTQCNGTAPTMAFLLRP
jgi:hypothetical protein